MRCNKYDTRRRHRKERVGSPERSESIYGYGAVADSGDGEGVLMPCMVVVLLPPLTGRQQRNGIPLVRGLQIVAIRQRTPVQNRLVRRFER